jgi:hypothetical protein
MNALKRMIACRSSLATVYADVVDQTLGALSSSMKRKLDNCLRVALGLP